MGANALLMAIQPRAPRFHVRAMHIIYDTGEGFWSAPVVDVSETGMFVETLHELPIGTRVIIVPDVPEEEQLPFEIKAEVVRAIEEDMDNHYDRTPGLAFSLVGMAVDQIECVRKFLAEHGVPSR